MDLDGYSEGPSHTAQHAGVDIAAAYAGYRAARALRRRSAARPRRAMDPGVRAFLVTFAVVAVVGFIAWITVLGVQGFNATR